MHFYQGRAIAVLIVVVDRGFDLIAIFSDRDRDRGLCIGIPDDPQSPIAIAIAVWKTTIARPCKTRDGIFDISGTR